MDKLSSPTSEHAMSYLELFPIVIAALLWGSGWARKRMIFMCDNEGTGPTRSQTTVSSPQCSGFLSLHPAWYRAQALAHSTNQVLCIRVRVYREFCVLDGHIHGQSPPPPSEDMLGKIRMLLSSSEKAQL